MNARSRAVLRKGTALTWRQPVFFNIGYECINQLGVEIGAAATALKVEIRSLATQCGLAL